MISKELLSKVLNCEVLSIDNEVHDFMGIISYMAKYSIPTMENPFDADINIYELAHKCKEWAWREAKEYEVVERKTQVDVYKNGKRVAQFIGDTLVIFLPSRVIEACEWIKDNK